MNLIYFLASKIRKTESSSFSSTVVKVGVASIAIGVATMIIAFSVLYGFKLSIKDKLVGLTSHIQIGKITLNRSYDETPLVRNSEIDSIFSKIPEVKGYHTVINKAAILKSEEEISGIIMKGIDLRFDSLLFNGNLVEGRWLNLNDSTDSKEILVSRYASKKLRLKLNDDVLIYFVQNPPRARKMKIVGIYDTGLIDFDKNLIFADLKLIQKLNNWNINQIGHYEVFLNSIDEVERIKAELDDKLPQDLVTKPITSIVPQFFEWFQLLDRNILLVIFLIMVVAAFNMISVLLIMIMERIPMIGLLKALGMPNKKIRQVFMTNGFLIIIKGLVLGNVIGMAIVGIQKYYKLVPLDPESYYIDYVPVLIDFKSIAFVNVIVVVIVGLTLLIPTLFITKINTVNALKYKD
jgi:lipoprotein-releasing system permease protein